MGGKVLEDEQKQQNVHAFHCIYYVILWYEFAMIIHRAKSKYFPSIVDWLNNIT